MLFRSHSGGSPHYSVTNVAFQLGIVGVVLCCFCVGHPDRQPLVTSMSLQGRNRRTGSPISPQLPWSREDHNFPTSGRVADIPSSSFVLNERGRPITERGLCARCGRIRSSATSSHDVGAERRGLVRSRGLPKRPPPLKKPDRGRLRRSFVMASPNSAFQAKQGHRGRLPCHPSKQDKKRKLECQSITTHRKRTKPTRFMKNTPRGRMTQRKIQPKDGASKIAYRSKEFCP